MGRRSLNGKWQCQSRRHRRRRHLPSCLDASGKHLSAVLADLCVDETIELFVHGHHQFQISRVIRREIVQLERIGVEIEQLDVVKW
jgi:hypothetical protein